MMSICLYQSVSKMRVMFAGGNRILAPGKLAAILCGFGLVSVVQAHPNPVGIADVEGWHANNISRVLTAGYPDSLGLYAFPRHGYPVVKRIDGENCVVGSALMLDVDDQFAFNIDETVELELLFYRNGMSGFSYSYDRNALAEAIDQVTIGESGSGWHRETVVLERARFANRGLAGTDIILVASGALVPIQDDDSNVFTLCGLSLKRTQATAARQANGNVDFEFIDPDTDAATAVRLGIYDTSGRLPLPGDDAQTIKVYDEPVRQLVLRDTGQSSTVWPVGNRYVFYTEGRYRAELPVGDYELVVSKGPEYRIVHEAFTVTAGKNLRRRVIVPRWTSQPKDSWYSGDVHIHISRESSENKTIGTFLAAEDVHVSNMLAMSNTAERHFDQYAWGPAGRYRISDLHHLVPGIEGPRTAHVGHTISLNIEKPLDDSIEYFHYHKAFEAYAKQGGLSGFAHVGLNEFSEWRGLAMEVPFDNVDFLEVMQWNELHTEIWYDFLNLGFQLTPVSGSDFPYFDQPGGERTYVQVDDEFTPQRWFDALAKGRAYVTNGPMLSFTVNGVPMGSTIDAQPGDTLTIAANARINPDIDELDRIELVKNGDVISTANVTKSGNALELNLNLTVEHGMWLALRAYGQIRGIAHSAPIYIHTETEGSWNREKAPETITRVGQWLDELIDAPIAVERELEYWEVQNMASLWKAQKPDLVIRANEARKRYDLLLRKIEEGH